MIATETVRNCRIAILTPDGNVIKQWDARPERLDTDILLFHNAIPFIGELIALVDAAPRLWAHSSVVGIGPNAAYTNSDHRSSWSVTLDSPELPEAARTYDAMCRAAEGSYITEYIRSVNRHAEVSRGSGYELLRYSEGQFFKEHVDLVRDHPILSARRLAVVAFGNDNFEGGELYFPRQNVTIKPEAGALVIFPANFTHPHESLPVVRGTKYSLVTWFF